MARPLSAVAVLLILAAGRVHAQSGLPRALREVRFDQKLDEQVPLDLHFKDESGETVLLKDLFQGKPVILNLAYFRCPMLCDQVMNGLVRALLDVPLRMGTDFNVITVSFDSRETPEMARIKKKTYLQRYDRPGAAEGWRFLTGDEESIKRLTSAVGFQYTYDPVKDEFAHASGLVLLTPGGRVSRYFFDIRFAPRDLRLGLVEASNHQIGSAADQILLFCFHYDPRAGKYGVAVMNLVRAGGVLTIIGVAALVVFLWRRDARGSRFAIGWCGPRPIENRPPQPIENRPPQ